MRFRLHLHNRGDLEWLTARMIEHWRLKKMGRLDEKFAKAGGIVGRTEKRIEDRLDALIGREAEIEKKTDRAFDRHNAPLDDQERALDALDRKLDLLSNGGPDGPLPGSGDSLEGHTEQLEVTSNDVEKFHG